MNLNSDFIFDQILNDRDETSGGNTPPSGIYEFGERYRQLLGDAAEKTGVEEYELPGLDVMDMATQAAKMAYNTSPKPSDENKND